CGPAHASQLAQAREDQGHAHRVGSLALGRGQLHGEREQGRVTRNPRARGTWRGLERWGHHQQPIYGTCPAFRQVQLRTDERRPTMGSGRTAAQKAASIEAMSSICDGVAKATLKERTRISKTEHMRPDDAIKAGLERRIRKTLKAHPGEQPVDIYNRI